ncbi:hypothetical protein GGR51DRAFT_561319 [Nemania sp. FL0031]|nr:hypothetical protein GGR51DRAFT_561319 [Nemania sp. FL0031]
MTVTDQQDLVAVVGMGCHWPGGVRDPEGLWEFLKNQEDGWREFDGARQFSAQGFHHANPQRPGTTATKGAFLVDEDPRLFDHTFFGISSLEAETLDPGQRKLLEVSYHAIENAGESWESLSGTRTGVFVGNFSVDHWMIQQRDWDYTRPYAFSGAGTSILANRISYIFNLQGPSLTVDTACSSSMYAFHLAVNAIRAGDCDAAIVAASNWIGDPGVQMALDKMGALSATSRCHSFDSKADGYARGEGFAALYLKRAHLAAAEGAPIRAIVRGSSINANGRSAGISRPSTAGQEQAIREAYKNARLSFGDTAYFECHGTGTKVGDPIEIAAVGNVFGAGRSEPLLVGSVKSNLGHSEGASALASIMKVVLSLEKGKIPPVYRLDTPNPDIDFVGAKVQVVTELRDWPEGLPRRVSVNSFGYGGANGHCILDHVHTVFPNYAADGVFRIAIAINGMTANSHLEDDAKEIGNASHGHNDHFQGLARKHSPMINSPNVYRAVNAETRRLVVLPFSAHSSQSLELNIAAGSKALAPSSLADIAFTLSCKRSKMAYRTFQIVDRGEIKGSEGIRAKSTRSPAQPTNKLGFVFTGQGAQWHGMGAGLFSYRIFRDSIEYLDEVLSILPTPPAWSLTDVLAGRCDGDSIQKGEVSQTACTALQIGLVDLLASWSVRPAGVVGHSSGEIAAAYASGTITAAEAIAAAYFRGQTVAQNRQAGAMLAVGLSSEMVANKYLEKWVGKIAVAAINSPASVTLSGDADAIEQVSAALGADGVFNRILKTGDNAYHSHHMALLGRLYMDKLTAGLGQIHALALDDRRQRYQPVTWISSVTPGKSPALDATGLSSYWRANLESPVRFFESVERLVTLGDDPSSQINGFIEIGPHAALKGPLNQITQHVGRPIPYVPALTRNEDGLKSILHLAGTLFCLNYSDIDLVAVNSVDDPHSSGLLHGSIAINLPPYQFAYGPILYHESRQSKEYRFRKHARHDLLGTKIPGTAQLMPQWRNILRSKDLPWLGQYQTRSGIVLPTAGLMAMALEATSRSYSELPETLPVSSYCLQNVHFKSDLPIPDDDYGVEVITSLSFADRPSATLSPAVTFFISSVARDDTTWTEHCTGLITVGASSSSTVQALKPVDRAGIRPAIADAPIWYRALAALGQNYGPSFRTLSGLRSTYVKGEIAADLQLDATVGSVNGGESEYVLHPTAIEGAFQLGLIACHDGDSEEAHAPFVPSHISRLSIWCGDYDASATAVAQCRRSRRDMTGGIVDLQIQTPSGKVILDVEGLGWKSDTDFTPSPAPLTKSPFARLVWKPDICHLGRYRASKMFPPPQENVEISPLWGITTYMAHMMVHDIYRTFVLPEHGPKPTGDVAHFLSWIKRLAERETSEAMQEARTLSNTALSTRINELAQQAPDEIEVKIMRLLRRNMDDILYQRQSGIDIIVNENLLTPLYQTGLLMTSVYPQLATVIDHLGHVNPHQRILEIGGGTGGATRIAMKALSRPDGSKRYLDYTFTDVSPGFLSSARESMAGLRDVRYSVLDCEVDPMEQGYECSYDLVIACQVLHATSNMANTMTNVRKLLRPGGHLVLVETNRNFTVPGMVVGTFTGYWYGIPDGRVDAPFQSLDAWDVVLKRTGFSGIDVALDDFPAPHNTTSVMLSHAVTTVPMGIPSGSSADIPVCVVGTAKGRPLVVEKITSELKKRNYYTTTETSRQARVLVILDQGQSSSVISEKQLDILRHLVREPASVMFLTCRSLSDPNQPSVPFTAGLIAGLRHESLSKRICHLDVDTDGFDVGSDEVDDLARFVADQQLALDRESNEVELIYREFMWKNGHALVGRYVPGSNTSFAESDALAARKNAPQSSVQFDPGASYIISGGEPSRLISIIQWMGDRGARYILLLSAKTDGEPQELRVPHSNVIVERLVYDLSDSDGAISQGQNPLSQHRHYPSQIKGLLHLANANSRTSLLQKLVAELRTTNMLRQATLNCPLDFFVLTTISSSGVQDASGAVESFQQSFAQHGRRSGIPMSAVSAKVIPYTHCSRSDSEEHGLNGTAGQSDAHSILTDHQFFRFLEPAFLKFNVTPPPTELNSGHQEGRNREEAASCHSFIALAGPDTMVSAPCTEENNGAATVESTSTVNSSGPSQRWAINDARMSIVMRALRDTESQAAAHESSNTGREGNAKLERIASMRRDFEAAITQGGTAERSQTVMLVEKFLKEAVADVLFIEADDVLLSKSIADHGLDSLVAAELRSWFIQALGVDVGTADLLDQSKTINQMAADIVDKALDK